MGIVTTLKCIAYGLQSPLSRWWDATGKPSGFSGNMKSSILRSHPLSKRNARLRIASPVLGLSDATPQNIRYGACEQRTTAPNQPIKTAAASSSRSSRPPEHLPASRAPHRETADSRSGPAWPSNAEQARPTSHWRPADPRAGRRTGRWRRTPSTPDIRPMRCCFLALRRFVRGRGRGGIGTFGLRLA